MPLGIGVVTYNRLPCLQELLERLRQHTRPPFHLVVADDGSTDGTADWCRENGITCITGPNSGIAWNKNRALYWLLTYTDADPIFLLEDDARVWEDGWEQDWVRAAALWGHVNYSAGGAISGLGTPENPFWHQKTGGVCVVSTRGALGEVGYLDSLFQGYGHEHAEWTQRFARMLGPTWPGPPGACPCLSAHIGVEWTATAYDPGSYRRNRQLMRLLEKEKTWRWPWRGKDEQEMFDHEVALALAGPGTAPPPEVRRAFLEYLHRVSVGYMVISWDLVEYLWEQLEIRQPRRILDLGSGFSSYLFRFWAAKHGAEVHSFETALHWLERTRQFLSSQGLGTEHLEMWTGLPPVNGPGFDFVLLDSDTLYTRGEHLGDALDRTAPGGVLILDDLHYPIFAATAQGEAAKRGKRLRSLEAGTRDRRGRFAGRVE